MIALVLLGVLGCRTPSPADDPLAQCETALARVESSEESVGALEAACQGLAGRDDSKALELSFRASERVARGALSAAARTRAIEAGEGLLGRGLATRCAIAQRVALLIGEERGKEALRARLDDLRRDAELAHAAECLESTRALLGSLGADAARSVGVGGSAPRIEALTPLFSERAARVVIALEASADAAVLGAIRVRDDRLSAGTVTSLHLPGILADAATRELAGQGLVTRVLTSAAADGTDVRFELSEPGSKRVHFLLEPPRVVIDLAPAARSQSAGRRVRRVVLDPGHGGFDPGAIGPSGLREKDVALDVALRAARALRNAGYDVRLTREDDRAVPIENRSALANAADADLFVSVHCNASESAGAHGIETYVLDDARGVKEAESSIRTAARENGGSRSGVLALSALLTQTRSREHGERSREFAEKLQRNAVAALRPDHPESKDGGVHPAAFSVLVGARMPAVLFETSYVTNPRETAWLGAPTYRQKLADAMVKAIQQLDP